MQYLLGIDFGGGASKATLLRTDGTVAAECTAEYSMQHPEIGACEQNPEDWLIALSKNTKRILSEAQISPSQILALAIDSATHSSVVCGADRKPLRPCLHWTDSRSRKQSEELREKYGSKIFEKTLHFPDTVWTLPQLCWLRENEPDLFKRIRYVFFEKDYIRYCLTDVFCTDRIEAQGSMLFDCKRNEWDPWLCELAGLHSSCLPPVREPTDVIGTVTPEAAKLTGLAAGIPVICGTTDTAMEVFASGAVFAGDMTVKLATAGRICVITDHPCADRHLVNYSHIVNGLWYPGTATKAAAASYRWYRDTFGGNYQEMDAGAKIIPTGCEGLIFHPYLNGELTPYGDPTLCGSFIGIRANHTRAHFSRAVLEGVALSLLDNKRYLDRLGIPHREKAILIGGGAKSALWSQITANALGICLKTVEHSDSSLGSAILAGVAVGVFQNCAEAVEKCVRKTGEVFPDPAEVEKYARLYESYKLVHDALAPIYKERK